MIDNGILELVEDINEISDISSREKKIEDAIHKMKEEWKYIKFDL
jgi:hypothetical protein